MAVEAVSGEFELSPGCRYFVFDDEAVVFNPVTWETHVLNPSATLVVDRLLSGAVTHAEIESLLAEVLDENERALATDHAQRLLSDLRSMRLIVERCIPADANR